MRTEMLLARVRRYRPGRLAINTLLSSFWQAIRVASQALWVVIIARQLGPNSYGAFSGIAGLAVTLGGFTGLGLGLVMHQEVSRHAVNFGSYWHNALRLVLISGIVFTGVFALVAPYMMEWHLSVLAIMAIGAAELLCFPVVTLCAFAFAAHERSGWSAAIPVLMACARLVAGLCFWRLIEHHILENYVWFHFGASVVAAYICLVVTTSILRPTPLRIPIRWRDIREGFGFSTVWATGIALSSLDKSLVLRSSGGTTAGLYTAVYRFTSVLAQPMDALVSAAMPRLFRKGAGDATHPRLLAHLALAIFGYAVLAGMILWAAADLLPILLGRAFAPAVSATRWMALFLPCYGLRMLGTNVLMASGCKKLRVLVEGFGLLTLFFFAIRWLPAYGLYGAVIMIIATEASLATLAWSAVYIAHRKPLLFHDPTKPHP